MAATPMPTVAIAASPAASSFRRGSAISTRMGQTFSRAPNPAIAPLTPGRLTRRMAATAKAVGKRSKRASMTGPMARPPITQAVGPHHDREGAGRRPTEPHSMARIPASASRARPRKAQTG